MSKHNSRKNRWIKDGNIYYTLNQSFVVFPCNGKWACSMNGMLTTNRNKRRGSSFLRSGFKRVRDAMLFCERDGVQKREFWYKGIKELEVEIKL